MRRVISAFLLVGLVFTLIGCEGSRSISISSLEFSPDGTYAAFKYYSVTTLSNGVCVVSREGGKLRLVKVLEEAKRFSWSPDGQRLAYIRQYGEKSDALCIYDLASGQTREVFSDLINDTLGSEYFSWSPDGKHIMCSAEQLEMLMAIDVQNGARIDVASYTNRATSVFLDYERRLKWAEWSQDGDQIAFVMTSDEVDGHDEDAIDVILDFLSQNPYPLMEVFVKDLQTGNVTSWGVVDDRPGIEGCYFDQGKIQLIYTLDKRVVEFTQNRPPQVVMDIDNYGDAFFSPNGEWLLLNNSDYIFSDDDWLFDLQNQRRYELRDLFKQNGIEMMEDPVWSSDSSKILFTDDEASAYLFDPQSFKVECINHREQNERCYNSNVFFAGNNQALCLYRFTTGYEGYLVNLEDKSSIPLDFSDQELRQFFGVN